MPQLSAGGCYGDQPEGCLRLPHQTPLIRWRPWTAEVSPLLSASAMVCPTCVNAKQYRRIIKQRDARASPEASYQLKCEQATGASSARSPPVRRRPWTAEAVCSPVGGLRGPSYLRHAKQYRDIIKQRDARA